jgi:hypothetical protein
MEFYPISEKNLPIAVGTNFRMKSCKIQSEETRSKSHERLYDRGYDL